MRKKLKTIIILTIKSIKKNEKDVFITDAGRQPANIHLQCCCANCNFCNSYKRKRLYSDQPGRTNNHLQVSSSVTFPQGSRKVCAEIFLYNEFIRCIAGAHEDEFEKNIPE